MNHDGLTWREQDALARLQAVLGDFVDVLGNLGAVAGIDVAGRGRWCLTAGRASVDGDEPVRRDHLFQVGSQSKTVLALTLLRLARAGIADLDAPAGALTGLPIDPRITLRHLVMNQGGLGEMLYGIPEARFDPRLAIAPRDLVALALPQGQLFAPGARFEYCNTGWVIVALAIAALTGKPHGEVVREEVLAPLGLGASWFGGGAPTERMTRGYIESEATGGPIDSAAHLGWAFGTGDGVASIDDMLNLFGSLIAAASPLGISLADLTAASAEAGDEPYFPLSTGVRYAMGLERRRWAGREVWGHPGSTYAYRSGTWVDAARGVTVSTCVTCTAKLPASDLDFRYPREQLFALALDTAYALAGEGR